LEEIAISVKHLNKSFATNITKQSSVYDKISTLGKKSNFAEKMNVLKDMSFEIKKGELVGIIGKNGIGKTTLLKVISNIYRPDSGQVKINGKVALFLELGTGFQLELTARENILLLGMLIGFKKNEIKQKIPEIMKYAGLEKFLDSKLKHFSSGMFARLAFSTAIQMEYDVFLIDELLAVCDEEFQKKSFDTFMELKKQGKTFLVVSHNHDMLKQISDRMMLIHNGKILSIGEPTKVMDEYNKSVKVWK
jgi:lipopolysaccharide transport system ATP-binding protein